MKHAFAFVFLAASPAWCQTSADRAAAMAKLSFMNGVWAGTASGVEHDGTPYKVHQTERMGPLLGGDVIVIEGRGYKDDGSTAFNALGIVSWDSRAKKYEFRSYAQGYAGTFDFKPTNDGYVWEIPMGDTVMRYTAIVKNGHWREIGERITSGKPSVQIFEMNLTRISDTDWPATNPVPANIDAKSVKTPKAIRNFSKRL